jgi:hypothetical protein
MKERGEKKEQRERGLIQVRAIKANLKVSHYGIEKQIIFQRHPPPYPKNNYNFDGERKSSQLSKFTLYYG